MANVSIARRYARALIEVASESGNTDTALTALESFTRLVETNGEFRDLVVNPAYTRAQRWAVLEQVLRSLGVTYAPVVNLFRLLVDRHRVETVPNILRLYRDMADQRAGRVRGTVTSAKPLSPEAVRRLEESLERMTQRNVVLQTLVDPTVIGGVSAQVGSILYDGTLKSQLMGLRDSLKR